MAGKTDVQQGTLALMGNLGPKTPISGLMPDVAPDPPAAPNAIVKAGGHTHTARIRASAMRSSRRS